MDSRNKINSNKLLLFIFFALLITITACNKRTATDNTNESLSTQTEDPSKIEQETGTTAEAAEQTDAGEADNQNTSPNSADFSLKNFVGTLYYSGYIGDSEIQMILTAESENQIYGEYWYTRYNTPISIRGFLQQDQLFLSSAATEETSNEYFQILIGSDLCLKGIWILDDSNYPCYLEQTDASFQLTVEKPSMTPAGKLSEFSDTWYGVHSIYYTNTILDMIPLYDDLIYFNLFARNGTYSGELHGIARYADGIASYETIGYDGEKVYFNFTKKTSDSIALDSSNYQHGCGAGVSFEAEYNRNASLVAPPEEISFLTEWENNALKDLTGEYYQEYIEVSQGCDDTMENLDDFNGKVLNIGMRGNVHAAIVMINTDKNTIMTAIPVYDKATSQSRTLYFSNDSDYPAPPITILNWIGSDNYKVIN